MTTVREFSATIQSILDEITVLRASISKSYTKKNTRDVSLDNDSVSQAAVAALTQEAATYDRKFEEEQHKFQANGGKSRKQTLQEFVILFFFVGYALFTVSLIMYGKTVGISTAKIFFGMLFALLMISGIIIRYA
jgi:hypothetical protein